MPRIQIDLIIVETHPRHTTKDPCLMDNLYRNSQVEPIIVSGPDAGNFHLIKGYRRLKTLEKAGHKYIKCEIIPLTSESERALLRLSLNHHRVKFNRFDEIELVEQLQNAGYTSKQIHTETNIPISRLQEHNRAVNLPLSLRQRAEAADVNPEGIVKLLNLRDVSPTLLDTLISMYITKKLPLSKIPLIKRITSKGGFARLPLNLQKECLLAILQSKDVNIDQLKFFFDNATVEEIVLTIQKSQTSLLQVLNDYPHDISPNLHALIHSVLSNWNENNSDFGSNGYQSPN